MNAIDTEGLGKRYGSFWALQQASLQVPMGTVSALVGPNGAGKTTLLALLTGLSTPSAGNATVLGRRPEQDPRFLATVGYLAQEVPLYRRLSADDHIEMGAHLNPKWDAALARTRLGNLHIPLAQQVGKLSGGQRSQVALALALAKRPQLLLLDEPVAALDPLARRDFLASLSEAVADGDLTVVMSSHLLVDLERICDHLVLLAASRTQLCGNIDMLLATHKHLVGPRQDITSINKVYTVVQSTHTARQTTLLVRETVPGTEAIIDPSWESSDVSLEELVLAYMGGDDKSVSGPMSIVGSGL